MLDLDPNRAAVLPRDAATLLLVREGTGSVEVFAVVRHVKSGFLGGAVVFPGGKVDPSDRDASWASLAPGAARFVPGEDEAVARAFAVAACREALEEAALLVAAGAPQTHAEVLALRAAMTGGQAFRDALTGAGLRLDLAALRPFARWVTPVAESRRFDTRFFVARAPDGQLGAHDARETTDGFWATPAGILARFERGDVQLAPPTHRCLELLASAATVDTALALAATLSLEPICPKLVATSDGGPALVLPGDPEHDVAERRVPGAARFVLRNERWLPE